MYPSLIPARNRKWSSCNSSGRKTTVGKKTFNNHLVGFDGLKCLQLEDRTTPALGMLAQPVGVFPTGEHYENNNNHWSVLEGDTITGTIVGATDAYVNSDGQVLVQIKSSDVTNTNLMGTYDNGTITFTWKVQAPNGGDICHTTIVAYNVTVQHGNKTTGHLDNTLPTLIGGTSDAAGYGIVNADGSPDNDCSPTGPTATVSTIIHFADENQVPVVNRIAGAPLGSSVHDFVVVTGTGGTPTGTVNLSFYDNLTGDGNLINFLNNVPLNNGFVDVTDLVEGPLHAGQYSFVVTYNGDSTYPATTSNPDIEPLIIDKGHITVSTVFRNVGDPVSTDINGVPHYALGSTVEDSIAVSPVDGTYTGFDVGTVSYTFQTGTDTPVPAGSGIRSDPFGPLHAGSYQFQASLVPSSDYILVGAIAPEPLVIDKGTLQLKTEIKDAITDIAIPLDSAGVAQAKLGASVYDTYTLSGDQPFPFTGTVDYTFKGDTAGSGTQSATQGPLHAGDYAFKATSTGDADYIVLDAADEPLHISKAPLSIVTHIYNATTNMEVPLSSSILMGASVYDTSIVSGAVAGIPIGTIHYTLQLGTNSPVNADQNPINNLRSVTMGPLYDVGNYAFQASLTSPDGYDDYDLTPIAAEPFQVISYAKTQGFWATHQSAIDSLLAANHLTTLTVAGAQYTSTELVNLLSLSNTGGNAVMITFQQLVAAKLNTLPTSVKLSNGTVLGGVAASPTVISSIADAETQIALAAAQAGSSTTKIAILNLKAKTVQWGTTGIQAFVNSSSTLGGKLIVDNVILTAFNQTGT